MIIGMTGSIASGKETLTKFLIKRGFKYYVVSDLLKEELKKRNLEITRENMQNIGDQLREKEGAAVLMKILLKKINPDENSIIDSLRNPKEAKFLRENLKKFILIAVDANRKKRFERILSRGRPSDPKNWEEFLKVDKRDHHDPKNPLGQQVEECIKMSDFVILNNGTLEEFEEKIKKVYGEILGKNTLEKTGVKLEEGNLLNIEKFRRGRDREDENKNKKITS